MPKSLEDIKKALEATDGGADLVKALEAHVSGLEDSIKAEKEKGTTEVKKRNSEAEGLRKFKKAMTDKLGFDPDEHELDDFVADIVDRLKEEKPDPKKDPQYKSLQKQVDKLTKTLETERQEKEDLRSRNQRSLMRSKLTKAFDNKAIGADLLADNLINSGKVKVDDDGETVVFVNGDETIEFDKGIEDVLKNRQDLAKNGQKPGGGSSPSGNTENRHEGVDLAERTKKLREQSRMFSVPG